MAKSSSQVQGQDRRRKVIGMFIDKPSERAGIAPVRTEETTYP